MAGATGPAGPAGPQGATGTTACPEIEAYGGAGDGSTDNTLPFASALAASPAGHLCVRFGPGDFYFANSLSAPLTSGQSLAIKGEGADVTQLDLASTKGITVNLTDNTNSVHFAGLTFMTRGRSSATGVTLAQPSNPDGSNTAASDFVGVTFRGADGYAVANGEYWATAISIMRVSNVSFIGDTFVGAGGAAYVSGGVGVSLLGSTNNAGVQFNFIGCLFNYEGVGISYGSWIQGVTVSQTNFVGGQYGVYVPPESSFLDQLSITSSQFNVSLNAVLESSAVQDTQITGSLFLVPPSANGILLSSAGNYTITGNAFNIPAAGMNQNGVVIGPSAGLGGGTITGNSFRHLTGSAIYLQPNSSGANVQANSYFGNSANVSNADSGNTVGGGSP